MARADTALDSRVYEEKKTSSLARSRQGRVAQAKGIGGTKLQCYDSHLPLLSRQSCSRPRGHREFDLARVADEWFETHLFVAVPHVT
jgi:hypothetical protein